jgi:large subunit ribosomal protein L21
VRWLKKRYTPLFFTAAPKKPHVFRFRERAFILGELGMMYAVIKTGGKQYKVRPGDVLKIEKLTAEAGENVDFDEVLLVGDDDKIEIGTPIVSGGKVSAMVRLQARAPKVKIIKFRRRKHYRKQMGHRQYYTEVQVTQIAADGFTTAIHTSLDK